MNVTDDIVARLRGTLPADGTLVTEYDRLCAHAAAVIEMLREDKATLRDILGMVKDERDARLTAEADADRLVPRGAAVTTDQFRDLLISYDNADDQLAARCDWLACPTCDGEGVEFLGDDDDIGDACPDCGGTGHPSVAQVLAWGEAVATAMPAPSIEGMIAPVYMEGYNQRLDALRSVKP